MPISVLLADDNAGVRKAIASLLQMGAGIHLLAEANSLTQTVLLAGTLNPHIVILDLHMDDGNDLTPSQIKSALARSQVLAISFSNNDEAKALADSYGAVTLLDKMTLADELIPAIQRYAKE